MQVNIINPHLDNLAFSKGRIEWHPASVRVRGYEEDDHLKNCLTLSIEEAEDLSKELKRASVKALVLNRDLPIDSVGEVGIKEAIEAKIREAEYSLSTSQTEGYICFIFNEEFCSLVKKGGKWKCLPSSGSKFPKQV